jgi:hypothetical protein
MIRSTPNVRSLADGLGSPREDEESRDGCIPDISLPLHPDKSFIKTSLLSSLLARVSNSIKAIRTPAAPGYWPICVVLPRVLVGLAITNRTVSSHI